MDKRLWKELVLYRRRVYHYNQRYNNCHLETLTLEAIAEATDIIPEVLISNKRLSLCTFIHLENNFENVIEYLSWLDSLYKTVKQKQYFTTEQQSALVGFRELSLESFLTNEQGMIYYPYVIINDIRSKVMRIDTAIKAVDDTDLKDYYQRRVKGFIPVISQPVYAIASLAGLKDE